MGQEAIYVVFGDLHGRVLPAFRLAVAWAREQKVRVEGILQVGDLGYFPDPSRLDKATARYAASDPLELGVQLVTQPSPEADAVFSEPDLPEALWFTAGNHEDFDALESWEHGAGARATSFAVDAYLRVHCIRDGAVATLPGNVRVGALWGVARQTRKNLPPRGWIRSKSAQTLTYSAFDILLTHDRPSQSESAGSGSEEIAQVIGNAQPQFAFFGHYRGAGNRVEGDFGRPQVFHLAGMELRRRNLYPEEGCMGILRWSNGEGQFEYVSSDWLMRFPRTQWLYW
ncbi:hypothetical protein AYO44_13775 [Planctomycetaceae bacterium SCGC AG-212-F19]|nr:hypothetical protein AYO44_13775 [Planctomycetaceae bacterium SCGC AG-212-F19]